MRRTPFLLLLFAAMCLSSCFGKGDDGVTTLSSDAEILSFKLTNSDTVLVLSKIKFSIDQVNNRIFNSDSVSFGARVISVKGGDTINIKCNVTTQNAKKIVFFADAANIADSLVWNGTDSLRFFSKNALFKVYSQNGEQVKVYDFCMGVYSLSADSFVCERLASGFIPEPFVRQRAILSPDSTIYMYVERTDGFELRTSRITDGKLWTKRDLQNFPVAANIESIRNAGGYWYVIDHDGALYRSPNGEQWEKISLYQSSVKALLGGLDDRLEMIVRDDASQLFLVSFSSAEQKVGTSWFPLPDNFPVAGFASVEYRRDYLSHLTLAGGVDAAGNLLNEVWTKIGYKEQGWMRVYDPQANRFSPRKGAVLLPYDSKLMLIGGYGIDTTAVEAPLKDIHFSSDQGISWVYADTLAGADKKVMPADFTPRSFASAMVDNRNFVTLIGGVGKDNTPLNDLWRGRIHRLAK